MTHVAITNYFDVYFLLCNDDLIKTNVSTL